MPKAPKHYDLDTVARRITEELGTEPSRSQLAKAQQAEERPMRMGRMRLTAGMPARDPKHPEKGWRRKDIEHWLANHPSRQLEQTKAELARAYAQDPDRRAAVKAAKDWGLSWSQIAEVISRVEGRSMTRQAAAARYR